MHALCQIIEKLVFLYISFSWTIQKDSNISIYICCPQEALSNISLHDGNLKLDMDENTSKDGRSVSKKVFVNGVKARKPLKMST